MKALEAFVVSATRGEGWGEGSGETLGEGREEDEEEDWEKSRPMKEGFGLLLLPLLLC